MSELIYGVAEEKVKWAKSLKEGDLIEDCLGKTQKIKKVYKRYTIPQYFVKTLFAVDLYLSSNMKFFDFMEDLLKTIKIRQYYDSDLMLEDGTFCSAVHCCAQPYFEE